ncbi:DUF488 domain-containing protein [Luteimonas sp. A611]
MDIRIKRAYEAPAHNDGARILVDRVWPRGLRKEALALDLWLKDIAPSAQLRKWFDHRAERFAEFTRRYHLELEANPDAVVQLQPWLRKGRVTLVYGARDEEHNQALVLRDWLLER